MMLLQLLLWTGASGPQVSRLSLTPWGKSVCPQRRTAVSPTATRGGVGSSYKKGWRSGNKNASVTAALHGKERSLSNSPSSPLFTRRSSLLRSKARALFNTCPLSHLLCEIHIQFLGQCCLFRPASSCDALFNWIHGSGWASKVGLIGNLPGVRQEPAHSG